MAAKTSAGNFFEDFAVGQVFHHAVPRTVTEGDLAVYIALMNRAMRGLSG